MPRIITARQLGLRFDNRFGALGPEKFVTIHHTAGPKDRDTKDAIRLCKQYHADHARKGWGGIGYAFCITRAGIVIGLRPTVLKGAHVGGHNTSNVGVMFHGTTGDKPTAAQIKTFRWLLNKAHTRLMPSAHRTDRPLHKGSCKRMMHKDWSGHTTNACAGTIGAAILRDIGR